MLQGKYPLLLWGTAQDFDTDWTAVNSCGVTASITDVFGETNGYTLNDASSGALRYVKRNLSIGARVTAFPLWFIVDTGNSTTGDGLISVYDTDATTHIRTCKVHISGGVVTLVGVTGSATYDLAIAIGSGFYLCRVYVSGIDPLNTNEIWIAPAATTVSDATSEGTLTIMMRSVVTFGRPWEDIKAWGTPRRGSRQRTISTGIRDSWRLGKDYFLMGGARRLYPTEQAGNEAGSGWDGADSMSGVDCGIEAMREAGFDSQTIRFVPDRTAAATFYDCYLESATEAPDSDRWVDSTSGLIALRQCAFVLRSQGDTAFRDF